MVEYLSHIHKAPGLIPEQQNLGLVAPICNSIAWKIRTSVSCLANLPVQDKFVYMRLSQKIKPNENKEENWRILMYKWAQEQTRERVRNDLAYA